MDYIANIINRADIVKDVLMILLKQDTKIENIYKNIVW